MLYKYTNTIFVFCKEILKYKFYSIITVILYAYLHTYSTIILYTYISCIQIYLFIYVPLFSFVYFFCEVCENVGRK